MSIIIRPSPNVFRRAMPLVVVFGAFQSHEDAAALPHTDARAITDVVGMARRFHVPLAFSRVLPEDRRPVDGTWLSGCRPKICDRVFDHAAGSCFQNREFECVFRTMTNREVFFVGPVSDSSLSASFEDASAFERQVRVITPDETLHFCSTPPQDMRDTGDLWTNNRLHSRINVTDWQETMCVVEHAV